VPELHMRKRRIASFHKILGEWYVENRRDLPWRHTTDPYAIWVSEVMLQQTQVNTVLAYYNNFLNRFPTPRELAGADLQEVLKSWEGMGYYGRARNLHKAAGIVMAQYAGMIPKRREEFRSLPGVGEYIASAVLSIAYGEPCAVMDGNVKRVLSRLCLMDDPVNRSVATEHFRQKAAAFLDRSHPGTFNQAMMELGAMVCRPGRPLCRTCPVNGFCLAFQSGRVMEFPKKVKKGPTPQYPIAAGIVFRKGQVLITRRKSEGLLGGLWEFPGGKVRKGETAENACIREIREEVNLKIEVNTHLCTVRHAYTHFKISMDVFCCSYISGRVRLNGPVDHRWIPLHELGDYPLPGANHKFVPKLKEYASRRRR